jgi:hypothetical protein
MRRRQDVASEEVDGELVALDLRSAAYFSANPAGALLWALLAEDTDEVALAQALADAYGIALGRALSDVQTFVDDLCAHGLVER